MGMRTTRSRSLVRGSSIAGFFLAIGLTFLIFWSRSTPSIDRARRAYDRRDWMVATSIASQILERQPDDPEAIKLQGRGLARLGRFRESLPLMTRLGGTKLEAEDLFLIGQGLITEHRSILGRVALEVSTRLDPKRVEASDTLNRLDRLPIGSAKTDRLLAIPDPSTLSELIVGLASLTEAQSSTAESDPTLDRILRRDRATFLRLNTPVAARKLLARGLLEEGRTSDALERLTTAKDGEDLELNWLLSRAYLADGDSRKADAALISAGKFGLDDPMAPEPSVYAGARRCAGCHAEIYQAQQNSHHSATVAWGPGLVDLPLPEGGVTDPENSNVVHKFDRVGENINITSTVDGKTFGSAIDFAIGSGSHGVTMLARQEDGRHRSLRMSYYSRGKHWGLTSGFESRPTDPLSYIGELLNEESFRNCVHCHTTRFTSERDRRGPEALDRGIGCERCHGPGENHIRAIESGFNQPAIARPRLASPSNRLKLCAQCHASDGVIPPADPRFIRFQGTTLLYSRCASESGGRLDCVACHDPHRDLETSAAYYEARCLACHGGSPDSSGPARVPGFRLEPVAAKLCPVDAKSGCISCHMPKVDKIMPFMSFTDHHIRVHRPVTAPPTQRASR